MRYLESFGQKYDFWDKKTNAVFLGKKCTITWRTLKWICKYKQNQNICRK